VSGGGSSVFLTMEGIEPVADGYLYIAVRWEASVEDNVVLSGGRMLEAEIRQGSEVPDDDLFEDQLEGFHYEPLGTWQDESGEDEEERLVWYPAGCGSYRVRACSNGFELSFSGIRDPFNFID